MKIKKIITLLCLFFSAVFVSVHAQQPSPYFPSTGNKAIVQEINQLKNPSVILMIAFAPGFEDRATIAYYRIGRGATVAVAYVTNGEDLPSDYNGEMFYQLASRRKEEAYQALSLLGAQSFFLNIPVNEFPISDDNFHSSLELTRTLDAKLDTLLSFVKPDVVVLNSDPLALSGRSARLDYFQHVLIAFIRSHIEFVKRIFVQTDNAAKAFKVPIERKNSLWKKSYFQIAEEASGYYKSLSIQIPLWENNRRHEYRQVFPSTAKVLSSFEVGLPTYSAHLKKLFLSIRKSYVIEKEKNTEKRLKALKSVIEETDASINLYKHVLDPPSIRVLTAWKSGLENLRCAVLGVDVPYSVSDSIVTPQQLFFFRIEQSRPWMKKGKAQIVFPGTIQRAWVVNESQQSFYALGDSQSFRVLSPRNISLTSTETPQGFSSLQTRAYFTFIVLHEDKNSLRNFMFRREIPLIIAPYRSVEILTPQIASYRDSAVVVRLRSNVRDRSSGDMYIADPLVSSPEVKVSLPGKNYTVTDTLPLRWKDTLITVNHEVKVKASGNYIIGNFVCRYLDVKNSTASKVGLYSIIDNSPLNIALHRLGLSPVLFNVPFTQSTLSKFSSIVIDQFSARAAFSSSTSAAALLQWVNNGGNLILLPQYNDKSKNPFLDDTINFSYLPLVGNNEATEIDSADSAFEIPNTIDENSFRGTMFPLSFGGLHGSFGDGMHVLMKSVNSQIPLLLRRTMGKGRVYYCSLNLFPRWLSLDEASYRLLANMLAQ